MENFVIILYFWKLMILALCKSKLYYLITNFVHKNHFILSAFVSNIFLTRPWPKQIALDYFPNAHKKNKLKLWRIHVKWRKWRKHFIIWFLSQWKENIKNIIAIGYWVEKNHVENEMKIIGLLFFLLHSHWI